MSSQENKLSGSNAKVKEYIDRIKKGEKGVYENMPNAFKVAVDAEFASSLPNEGDRDGLLAAYNPDNSERLDLLSGGEKDDLISEIKKIEYNIYRRGKGHLEDAMFAFSEGIDIDTGESYEKVSGEIGQYFDAHGIAKFGQLSSLLSILENGFDPNRPLHTAPFDAPDEMKAGLGSGLGTASGTAYKNGIAVLTSGYREKLIENGIKHVFINDAYSELVAPLSKAFPKYKFHKLSEQKVIMEGEAGV